MYIYQGMNVDIISYTSGPLLMNLKTYGIFYHLTTLTLSW